MPLTPLIRDVMVMAREALAGEGFTKRSGDLYTVEVNRDVLGWVGLPRATKYDFSVTPMIGVRHQPLELRLAEVLGVQFHPYIPATVSQRIGYLMPKRSDNSWTFADGLDNRRRIADMVCAIVTHGRSFMAEHSDLDSICEAMAAGLSWPHQTAVRLPIGILLLGRSAEARQMVREQVKKLGNRDDAAAEYYRRFAARLFPELNAPLAKERGPRKHAPEQPAARILISRSDLARNLQGYGEDNCAKNVLHAPDEVMELISKVAATYALTPKRPGSRNIMLLAKAVSLAAIEVLEGQPRMLRRKTRRLKETGDNGR